MSARCPYEVLEVEPGAPFSEIRRAYERIRAIFGPTSLAVYSLVSPEEQRAVLLEIEDAYRILSDPELRASHDGDHGHAVPEPEPLPPAVQLVSDEPSVQANPAQTVMQLVSDVPAAVEPLAPPLAPEVNEAPAVATPRLTPPPLPVSAAPPAPVEPPEPETPLPAITEETVFTGDLLRTVRMARKLSIREIADRTKISPTHLESIEKERWDWLPARVFLRGFLVSLARELRLDPEQVSRTFLARREGAG